MLYILSNSFSHTCNGSYEVICYSITGPTSFAPVIEMATTIVEQSGGQYHVLLIIADGQVLIQFKGKNLVESVSFFRF